MVELCSRVVARAELHRLRLAPKFIWGGGLCVRQALPGPKQIKRQNQKQTDQGRAGF
jgi:hypothetical protein